MSERRPSSRSNLAPVLAGSLLVIHAVSVHAAGPGVDGSTATPGSIEALLCGSSLLSTLDAEVARLYGLATRPATGVDAASIERDQRGWLARRDRCLQAAAPERGALDQYLARIAALRTASAAARSDDRHGISLGPFEWQCGSADGRLATVFVNSDPAFLFASGKSTSLTMWRAISGSGAKYQGPDDAMFWEHQGEATFRARGSAPEVRCVRAASPTR
jgi:uncharacterized protein